MTFEGHRKRIKTKILLSMNLSDFYDYEILESLLMFCIPRRDVREYSKSILKSCDNKLSTLLFSDTSKIKSIDSVNDNFIILIKIIKDILIRAMSESTKNVNIISNWSSLVKYLKFTMGFLPVEEVRILFLNQKNYVIANEIHSKGDVSSSVILVREIIKRVLFHDASSVILIHNHPSGFSNPSDSDIRATNHLLNALQTISVTLYDHVIITSNDYFSFRNNLLI